MMPREITPQALAEKMATGEAVYLLDVRQELEHQTAALPNSKLIPLDQLATRAGEIELPDDALLVTYCHHGIRSLSAAALLHHLGFTGVVSLQGGIDAWSLLIDASIPRYE